MGGRGGASGIVAVAKRTRGNWDYKGNDQRISQLSGALSGARSASKINSVAKSLRANVALLIFTLELLLVISNFFIKFH